MTFSKNVIKTIPFLIVLLISTYTFMRQWINDLFMQEIIIGFCFLIGCLILKLKFTKTWGYLFLAYMIAVAFQATNYCTYSYFFGINGFKIDVIAILIVLSHLALNAELFIKENSTNTNTQMGSNKKPLHKPQIDYFQSKFKDKNIDELTNMINSGKLDREPAEACKILIDARKNDLQHNA